MPGRAEILEGLTAIAREGWPIAALWHVAVAAVLVGISLGWRPRARTAALASVTPLASVALSAFAFGNPVNGLVFAVLSTALAAVALRLPLGRLALASGRELAIAGLMIGFAWLYPHFLDDGWRYLYAAPLGLIPCPTLALVVGITLATRAFGSRAWALVTVAASLAYGLSGWLYLGVGIDAMLVAAALGVMAQRFSHRRHDAHGTHAGRVPQR